MGVNCSGSLTCRKTYRRNGKLRRGKFAVRLLSIADKVKRKKADLILALFFIIASIDGVCHFPLFYFVLLLFSFFSLLFFSLSFLFTGCFESLIKVEKIPRTTLFLRLSQRALQISRTIHYISYILRVENQHKKNVDQLLLVS